MRSGLLHGRKKHSSPERCRASGKASAVTYCRPPLYEEHVIVYYSNDFADLTQVSLVKRDCRNQSHRPSDPSRQVPPRLPLQPLRLRLVDSPVSYRRILIAAVANNLVDHVSDSVRSNPASRLCSTLTLQPRPSYIAFSCSLCMCQSHEQV